VIRNSISKLTIHWVKIVREHVKIIPYVPYDNTKSMTFELHLKKILINHKYEMDLLPVVGSSQNHLTFAKYGVAP
jgi:hypothetical protein